ncbi:MAG TPA: energy transducer TonB [Myxococcota bacterium]|nr:energy transducer TonB [Myxococcota bacterium]
MRPSLVASAVAATLLHGFLLFGLHLDQPAVPLPPAPGPLVVGLVAASPAPGPAAPTGPAPAAAQPATPPEPAKPERKRSPNRPTAPKPPVPKMAAREETNPAPVVRETPPEGGASPTASGSGVATGQPGAPGGPAAGGALASAVPRYRNTPPPEYPPEARQRHQEGIVLLDVDVGADGRPAQVGVKQSSGFPSLDRAAVTAVHRWTFEPARTAGLPVASRVEIPIRFRLTD